FQASDVAPETASRAMRWSEADLLAASPRAVSIRAARSDHEAAPEASTVTCSNCAMLTMRSSRTMDPSSSTLTSVTDLGPLSPTSRPCGMPGITMVQEPSAVERLWICPSAQYRKPEWARSAVLHGA